MGFKLSGSQLAAIIRLATLVIKAGDMSDSNKKTEEMALITLAFGIKNDTTRQLANLSISLRPSEIDSAINSLGRKEKKWLTAFLGRLIDVGGKYSENEMFVWQTIRETYNLPSMEMDEVRRIISECLTTGNFHE